MGSKYSSKKHLTRFLIPQFIQQPYFNITDIDEESYHISKQWLASLKRLQYQFKEDLDHLLNINDLKTVLSCKDEDHPIILKELLCNNISINSFVIFDNLFSLLTKWKLNDIMYNDRKHRIQKYSTFIKYDSMLYKDIIKSKLKI